MRSNMHLGAPAAIFSRARELRKNLTPAEKHLWQFLRDNQLGRKIRQQHPMILYVVDYYCHAARLVIEIDGHIHSLSSVKLTDIEKEKNITDHGITVIRFSNYEVFHHTDFVIKTIQNKIHELIQKRYRDNPKLYSEHLED
jgi:cyclase